MATYKVWLKVKNKDGTEKEIPAGEIVVDFALGQEELSKIEKALPLEDYLKKIDIGTELDAYATDTEVEQAVQNTVKYGEFELKEEEAGT